MGNNEDVVQVAEGHEAEIGVLIVELRKQLRDVMRSWVGRDRRGRHGGRGDADGLASLQFAMFVWRRAWCGGGSSMAGLVLPLLLL